MRHDIDKEQHLCDILGFQDDHEKLEFEAEMIHLDIMHQIRLLMSGRGMTHEVLACELNVSDDDLTGLFSADRLADLRLLARLQRIFGVRFELIPKAASAYDEDEEPEDENQDEHVPVPAIA